MNHDLAAGASLPAATTTSGTPKWCWLAVIAAGAIGLGLMADSVWTSSATYDEVTYLEISTRWWRTGDQALISRMGSPLLFWKLQQAPVLWILDQTNHGNWIDQPVKYQEQMLPWLRLGCLWIWAVALALIVIWSRALYGPRAMAFAALIFAFSPTLLGHAALVTMEIPIMAATTGMFFLFWKFLQTDDRRYFWATAVVGGLAWSLKYTAVLIPPMLAAVWVLDSWRRGDRKMLQMAQDLGAEMLAFLAIMGLSNLVLTQFALLPMSQTKDSHPGIDQRVPEIVRNMVERAVEVPIPQEIVGFANQVLQQRSGGLSYLFGERRGMGWWYYYFVAIAVKLPLTFFALILGRTILSRQIKSSGRDSMLLVVMALFLFVTAIASSRNFGIRYLFPISPLAIIWVSGLAESSRIESRSVRRFAMGLAVLGLMGQVMAVASVHPHEITYFNEIAGGPVGGRKVLADSNLDWGQGLKSLTRLQQARPELKDMTLFYFGNIDPRNYGVAGKCLLLTALENPPELPPTLSVNTPYVAISASLEWGPWGPENYFSKLRAREPLLMTDDHTIAIYRKEDLEDHNLSVRAN